MSCRPPTRPGLPRQAPPQVDGARQRPPRRTAHPRCRPPPLQLAWLLVQPPSALSMSDAALVARVEQAPPAAHVAGLARRLAALVRVWGQSDGRLGGGAHGVDRLA